MDSPKSDNDFNNTNSSNSDFEFNSDPEVDLDNASSDIENINEINSNNDLIDHNLIQQQSANQNNSDVFNTDILEAQNASLASYYRDMSHIQPNLATHYKPFTHDLTYIFKMVPLTFFLDYEKNQIYEFSQKIIAPKSLLLNISEYENLSLPIYIKINDSDKIFGIIDYVEFIDHIYIPYNIFTELKLEENTEQIITILKEHPPKANFLKIKPLNEEFYDVPNIKTYLEVWLKKMFIAVSMGEIITLPFGKRSISLYIEETRPSPVVSIYEIEEIEIDLLPMDEYKNKSTMLDAYVDTDLDSSENTLDSESQERSNILHNTTDNEDTLENKKDGNSNKFVAFSGKGNRLGSS